MGAGTAARCTCIGQSSPPHAHEPTCRIFQEYLHATMHRAYRTLEEDPDYPYLRHQLYGATAMLG